ncbi:MAG: hypothetical protein AAGK78_02060 [Planctomycetota bacterium]
MDIDGTQLNRTVAILGSGPIGLEAALAAGEAGLGASVVEAGDQIAAGVRSWGHVRMFSPWRMNTSERGRKLVGLDVDLDACPTGHELCDHYLDPLAEKLSVDTGRRVAAVSKATLNKYDAIGDGPTRAADAFRVLLETAHGEMLMESDIVFDCTGSYGAANARWAGTGGMPAVGERAAREAGVVETVIPDFEARRDDFAGKHVILAGKSYSAMTALRALADVGVAHVHWIVRDGQPLAATEGDPLDVRSGLVNFAADLLQNPPSWLTVHAGHAIELMRPNFDGTPIAVYLGGNKEIRADKLLSLVGYRPDESLWKHLQVHQCYATTGPMKLAATLLGETDCMTAGQGNTPDVMLNPEPNFFVLGSKSYGTNSAFLLQTGLKQIDDVLSLLASD